MFNLEIPISAIVLAAGAVFVTLQLALSIIMIISLRVASKERALLNREMFGLLKKLEGITATRREQMIRHYDRMLEGLMKRLPPTIAAQTSQVIFDTESKILTRLAELEPSLKADEEGQKKMNELIKSMESLDHTLVSCAADTVRSVMAESRRSLLEDDCMDDLSLAA